MPYIGRNHITGDHTSNFKVLDDISSHTATFNGSSSTIVSTTDETIRIPEHRFLQGQRVTYSNGSSTTTIAVTVGTDTVGGQSTGVFYFDGRKLVHTLLREVLHISLISLMQLTQRLVVVLLTH